jgi:hypothetical protein
MMGPPEARPRKNLLMRSLSTRDTCISDHTTLISIVDDDRWVCSLSRKTSQSAGFRAQVFGSAEEYLESGNHYKTARLVLDARLPGMSICALAFIVCERHHFGSIEEYSHAVPPEPYRR